MKFMLLSLLLALASCASAPPTVQYALPIGDRSTLASISGSQIKRTNLFLDDSTAFISKIDGNQVAGGKKNWEKRVSISPGERQIAASFSYGSYKANAVIALKALPGREYRLQTSNNAKWRGGDYYCDFWIIDTSDNKAVSSTVRADITYTQIIFVP